jgi:hypothetical protein
MANVAARGLVQQHLRFSSYLTLRIVVPLLIYVPLSLSYALVNLAFNLPFGSRSVEYPLHCFQLLAFRRTRPLFIFRYDYASGFFLFLVYVYLAMASLGLSLESMITLLTPRFVAFFLFTLVSTLGSTTGLTVQVTLAMERSSSMFPLPYYQTTFKIHSILTAKDSRYGTF